MQPADEEALTVLIADDNMTDRMLLSSIVRRQGHAVITASNGQEALDTLPTAQPHRLTSQEVQSCARWLRAGGQAISFDGLCRALSLSTWERMLPANRVLLGEGVSGLD